MNASKKFRLQKVLEVRKLLEKERQKEFASTKQKLQEGQEELKNLERKRNNFTQRMNKITKASVSHFIDNQAYLESLNVNITDKRTEIAILEKQVEEKRRQLLAATKEKKALEKLKERKTAEAIQEENRIEQAFIDEIAMQKTRHLTNLDNSRNH